MNVFRIRFDQNLCRENNNPLMAIYQPVFITDEYEGKCEILGSFGGILSNRMQFTQNHHRPEFQMTRKHNLSETGPVLVLR